MGTHIGKIRIKLRIVYEKTFNAKSNSQLVNENTSLSFKQISEFVGLHPLEVENCRWKYQVECWREIQ